MTCLHPRCAQETKGLFCYTSHQSYNRLPRYSWRGRFLRLLDDRTKRYLALAFPPRERSLVPQTLSAQLPTVTLSLGFENRLHLLTDQGWKSFCFPGLSFVRLQAQPPRHFLLLSTQLQLYRFDWRLDELWLVYDNVSQFYAIERDIFYLTPGGSLFRDDELLTTKVTNFEWTPPYALLVTYQDGSTQRLEYRPLRLRTAQGLLL